MNMMRYAEKQENHETFCVAWLSDGRSFVIRDADAFTRQVVPQFFKATKFSSFTRKLYRWGFRQVNRGIGPDDPIIFGNEYFQRDHAELMVKMRSITAGNVIMPTSQKKRRAMLGMLDEEDDSRKRMYSQQMEMGASGVKQQQQINNMGLNLTSALRPNFAMLQQLQQQQEQQRRLSLQLNNFQQAALGMHHQHNQQQHMNNNMQQHMNKLFLPQQQPFHHQQQHQQMNFQQQQQQMPGLPQFPTASTADIVNAAIDALRFAS